MLLRAILELEAVLVVVVVVVVALNMPVAAAVALAFLVQVAPGLAEQQVAVVVVEQAAEQAEQMLVEEALAEITLVMAVLTAVGAGVVAPPALAEPKVFSVVQQSVLFGPVTRAHSRLLVWGHHELVYTN